MSSCSLNSRVSRFLLLVSIFLNFFPGFILTAVVTLDSIQIFTTHEWLNAKPTVYFQCHGGNKSYLPDVREKGVLYTFMGEESFQPLTEFPDMKCKRCGFYEEDSIKKDDVFDEWEFCPSEVTVEGKYSRMKDNELNVTFLCRQCGALAAAAENPSSSLHFGTKALHVVIIVLVSVAASTLLIIGVVAAYKFWQKKKRQQDQARFLKLFEDGDDIEDELGLDNNVV